MKFIALAIAALNLFLGTRCFLNVIHVLHTSKYSTASTAVFAVLFLALGGAGLYFTMWGGNPKLGLWLGIGPWALSIVVMAITLVSSNHQ